MNRPSRGYSPCPGHKKVSGHFRVSLWLFLERSVHHEPTVAAVPRCRLVTAMTSPLCVDRICHVRDDAEHHCPHRGVHEHNVFFGIYVLHRLCSFLVSLFNLPGIPLPQNQKEPLARLWLSGICECRYHKHRQERRRHCDDHEHAVDWLVTQMYIFVHKQKTPFFIFSSGRPEGGINKEKKKSVRAKRGPRIQKPMDRRNVRGWPSPYPSCASRLLCEAAT